ncbi:MAG: 3-hydroxyacyl-ACP dehydratase FabZ [Alphaproteobacteria bacterium]
MNLAENNIVDFEASGITLNLAEIQALIPHRYPFLLIDRIENVHLGESAVGVKNVTLNEWYFQGHFPEHPIMPGVLIIEALAQTAAALVMKTLTVQNGGEKPGNIVYFMSIDEAKFRRPVVPGDVLKLKVTKNRERGHIWKFKGEAWVGDELADEAIFTAMITSK